MRTINEIVAIMIDIDIDASLDGMTAPYFREVIAKLKTPVRGGKLKAVSAENNAFIGVLDNDCRECWGSIRQIKVIVVSEVEAEFVQCGGRECSVKGELQEMAGRAIRQAEPVARGCRSVEVSVGTAKTLIVIGDVEGILVIHHAIDFAEGRILIEAAGMRPGGGRNERGNIGVIGKIICGQSVVGEELTVIHRKRFVPHLAFIVCSPKESVSNDGTAYRSSKLLATVVRFSDAFLFVNLVIRVQLGIKEIVIAIAMQLVGAALGDGVYDAAARLAELGIEAIADDLELLNDIFAELEGDACAPNLLGEEGIVVVRAIDGVVVVVSGQPIEADHAKVTVGGDTRGEQNKVREVAAVQGQCANGLLVHNGAQR